MIIAITKIINNKLLIKSSYMWQMREEKTDHKKYNINNGYVNQKIHFYEMHWSSIPLMIGPSPILIVKVIKIMNIYLLLSFIDTKLLIIIWVRILILAPLIPCIICLYSNKVEVVALPLTALPVTNREIVMIISNFPSKLLHRCV